MNSNWVSTWIMRPLREWKAGLLECLPPPLRRQLAPPQEPYVLEISDSSGSLYRILEDGRRDLGNVSSLDQQLDTATKTLLGSRQDPFILKLPASWVLRKRVSLPAAAKENLRQVLGFEMDRLTPFALDQVYFDYQVEEATGEGEVLAIDVAVVTRKRAESWLTRLRISGTRPDVISADGLWPSANFLPLEERPAPDVKKVLLKTVPITAVVVLLVVAMAFPLWQKRRIATALQGQEAALRQKAGVVIEIREKLELEQSRFDELLELRAGYPPAIDVLRIFTDILPDDTWLQQLEIKGKSVVIRGLSTQALSLLKTVEEASGFENVKFLSSVVQQRGKESFHLSADMVTPFSRDWVETVVVEEVEESTSKPGKGQPGEQNAESAAAMGKGSEPPHSAGNEAAAPSGGVVSRPAPMNQRGNTATYPMGSSAANGAGRILSGA